MDHWFYWLDIVVNNIARMHKVIFYHFRMHRLNHPVHSISAAIGAQRFMMAILFFWIPHTDQVRKRFLQLCRYNMKSTHCIPMQSSSVIPRCIVPLKCGTPLCRHRTLVAPPYLSNYKNTHYHIYHNIPINVHYSFIVNKDIYFKKSSFLLIYTKILAIIIYLLLSTKKYKKKVMELKITLWSKESIWISFIKHPFIFQVYSAVFSFYAGTSPLFTATGPPHTVFTPISVEFPFTLRVGYTCPFFEHIRGKHSF